MRSLLAALGVGVATGLAVAPAAAVELEGTWYVLVHYQDGESSNPEAWRWDDRVWRFESRGDRLAWTEWPIVSFQDETGRFESLSGNRAARVVAAWEPNQAQLADVRDGLAVNSRGSKTKTLRSGPDGATWSSGDGAGGESAMVITYSETWTIEGLPDAPVFRREDALGSAATESMEGLTLYRTEAVLADGDELTGRFERDGTRVGRFRMIRSGDVGRAGTDDLEERQRRGAGRRAADQGLVAPQEVAEMMGGQVQLGAGARAGDRDEARRAIRAAVEAAVVRNGNDPASVAPAVDRMTRRIERALFDEGRSVEEVQRLIETGRLGP